MYCYCPPISEVDALISMNDFMLLESREDLDSVLMPPGLQQDRYESVTCGQNIHVPAAPELQ